MSHTNRWPKRALSVVSALPTGRLRWNHQPMALLDKWGHKLKAPRWLQNQICDEFDRWVGLYDDSDVDDDVYAEEDCD